jgi:AcrR family transcriptional regulator
VFIQEVLVARTVKRISADERRQKIVDVTLRLVAHDGIEGATTAKIAAAAGVSEGTLYRLFGNKTGILIAALNEVHEHFLEMLASCQQTDPVERLQAVGRLHTGSLVSSGIDHYIGPLFAFISAPVHVGLREAVAKGQQRIMDAFAQIVDEGKAAGTVPANADSNQVAWMLAAIFWAEDISSLLALPSFVLEGRSKKAIHAALRCFARCSGCPEPVDGVVRPGVQCPPGTPVA